MNYDHHLARMQDSVEGAVATAAAPACPACGQAIDHCLGHGMLGDPVGYHALTMHGDGDHTLCHPNGCEGES